MSDIDREARARVYAEAGPLLLSGISLGDALSHVHDEAVALSAIEPGSSGSMLALRMALLAAFLRGGERRDLPPPRLVPAQDAKD